MDHVMFGTFTPFVAIAFVLAVGFLGSYIIDQYKNRH